MSSARIHIMVGNASFEAEGPTEFVSEHVQIFESILTKALATGSIEAVVRENEPGPDEAPETAKKQRRKSQRAGPGCRSRIDDLISEDFFKSGKVTTDIKERLSEKSTPYASNHIAAAMNSIVKSGSLRRHKEAGHWTYINP